MRIRQLLIVTIAIVFAACMAKSAAADDVPQVTRGFLPYCKTHLDSCYEEIATIIVSNAATRQKTFCVPQSVLVSTATYTASHRLMPGRTPRASASIMARPLRSEADCRAVGSMSAFGHVADSSRTSHHVRFVPTTEVGSKGDLVSR